MSQARALYRLQKLDLDIDMRRSRTHEITAALEQDQTLREAQAQVADLENTLRPQGARLI
jgi:predicted  nucleic acid-binding Zn-ribbon protein